MVLTLTRLYTKFCPYIHPAFPSGLSRTFPYIALAVMGFVFLIDPALANIFAKPTQKATLIKNGLMIFAKVSVAVAFLACLLGALAGKINWRWVAIVFIVAIAIATFDILLGFLEVQ